jgi:hypothetical protein
VGWFVALLDILIVMIDSAMRRTATGRGLDEEIGGGSVKIQQLIV